MRTRGAPGPGLWLCAVWVATGIAPLGAQAEEIPLRLVEAERARIEIVAKALRTAVSVFAPNGSGGGSGVVISPDGFALSNYHVTAPLGSYMRCGMADGRLYDAVIVSVDPTGDVALIKLFGRNDFPWAELGNSDQVRPGDWCFAVGNPFLLATDLQPTVTSGIVSGVHRYQYPAGSILEYTDCIQTDAAINPGNSGGPLFDAQGRLIGINGRCSFDKRGRLNVGVGYAVSAGQIKNFLGQLYSGRIVDHASLGATVAEDSEGRVLVSNILENSDAYRRGLRYGDEILAFGGRPIGSANELKNVLGIYPKGWRVPLSYRRDGVRRDIHVRLAGLHSQDELRTLLSREVPQPELPPEKPGGRKGEGPGKPAPAPSPPAKPPIPAHLEKYIQPRPGYANYYFNTLHRQRVWDRFQALGRFGGLTGPWRLQGRKADGSLIDMLLGDEESSLVLPQGRVLVSAARDLGEQLQPEGSGGLVVALHLWRRLLVAGPERFGEVYYLGTAPLVPQGGPLEVLVAVHDVIESHFRFDPASGHLVAVEMFPDSAADPCEIHFADHRPVGGRAVPHRLVVRHGDSVFAEIQLDRVELPTGGGPKA